MVEVSTFLVGFIEILLHIWDVITYPAYALAQRLWRQRSKIRKTRAMILTHQATEITIRAVPMANKICDEMEGLSRLVVKILTITRFHSLQLLVGGTLETLGLKIYFVHQDILQPDHFYVPVCLA